MKKIILPVAILIGYAATAQNNGTTDVLKKLRLQKTKTPAVKITPTIVPHFDIQKQSAAAYTLSNGNKVITLPQDNMPCIIPEMQSYNMPNAFTSLNKTEPVPGKIPNVADKNKNTILIDPLDIDIRLKEKTQESLNKKDTPVK